MKRTLLASVLSSVAASVLTAIVVVLLLRPPPVEAQPTTLFAQQLRLSSADGKAELVLNPNSLVMTDGSGNASVYLGTQTAAPAGPLLFLFDGNNVARVGLKLDPNGRPCIATYDGDARPTSTQPTTCVP